MEIHNHNHNMILLSIAKCYHLDFVSRSSLRMHEFRPGSNAQSFDYSNYNLLRQVTVVWLHKNYR